MIKASRPQLRAAGRATISGMADGGKGRGAALNELRVERTDGSDSMSMFRELVARVLDDGYAEAAARRSLEERKRRTPGRMSVFFAVLMALGLLLTVAAVQAQRAEPEAEREKAELIARVEARTARVDELSLRAADLQEDVSALQGNVLENSSRGQALQERIAALELLTGTAQTKGPGLVITVDDAPTSGLEDGDPADRILDLDLQHLANGLWWAGAEAVSINGQRLTSLTAIRGADKAITVDYRPLARPYVVEAIGDPETLEAEFVESTGGAWFASLAKNQNIRYEISSSDDLELPADSSTQLRFATTGGTR